MSVVSGVHHVALIVSDYEASKRFYTEVMGFSVLAEHYREERTHGNWTSHCRMGSS